jgi:urease accessory protein
MHVEAILGNVKDEVWSARLERGDVDSLQLDQWEAQKNRLRKQTDGGTEITLALPRGTRLRDGDVLAWLEDQKTAVVASIDLGEVMAVNVDTSAAASTQDMVRAAIELGHALGNQHWPAVVKGTSVYVPLTVDRRVMASVMRTHDLPGVSYEFVPGTEIIAYLAPHEARRLFGGADSTPHSHVPAELS